MKKVILTIVAFAFVAGIYTYTAKANCCITQEACCATQEACCL